MKKYIIGLGCSWTQGEGGYPDYIWKLHKGRVQLRGVPDEHLRVYEHENSWVNVLCKKYFNDHVPMNLGARGIGNRASVKQLYFCDNVDFNNSTGYIILMLSGVERFDFFSSHPKNNVDFNDGYSNGEFRHYKWNTMWPTDNADGEKHILWKYYLEHLHTDVFVATETAMAILELQNFCRAHNFIPIIANAFNIFNVKEFIGSHNMTLHRKINWNNYLHTKTNYDAMVQKLVELDGDLDDWKNYYMHYDVKKWPLKYLTNCCHPNVDGYAFIADEIAKFIKKYVN